jgi:hypothetical protein
MYIIKTWNNNGNKSVILILIDFNYYFSFFAKNSRAKLFKITKRYYIYSFRSNVLNEPNINNRNQIKLIVEHAEATFFLSTISRKTCSYLWVVDKSNEFFENVERTNELFISGQSDIFSFHFSNLVYFNM